MLESIALALLLPALLQASPQALQRGGPDAPPAADLRLAMAVAPDPALVGSDVTFTLSLANAGPSSASDVMVWDTIPAPLEVLSCSSTGGGVCGGTGRFRNVSFGSLPKASSSVITIVARLPATVGDGTVLASQARVRAKRPGDPNPADNRAVVRFTASTPKADLAVTANGTPDPVAPDSTLTYTILLENRGGGAPAADVVVEDPLPGELDFVSCVATGAGACGGVGNARSVSFPSLAAGASETIRLAARVKPATALGSTIRNTAGVRSSVVDANAANDTSTSVVTVMAPPPPGVVRPDIVLVVADDQPRHEQAFMPLTNALVGGAGVDFQNAVAHAALCDPSRATLLTGLFVHHHGVTSNNSDGGTGEEVFDWSRTFAVPLRAAGYRTALVGKDFASSPFRAPIVGWDVFEGAAIAGNDQRKFRRAVEIVNSTPERTPLLLYVGAGAPHYPAAAPADDLSRFAALAPWRPGSHDEADVSDKPLWVRALKKLTAVRSDSLDAFYRRQAASLQPVDRGVQDVLGALEARGRLEGAVVIYVSDHGIALGEHRQFRSKNCPYEECIAIPLQIRAPDALPRVDANHLVSTVDIYATVCDYAGVTCPPRDGRSIRPLIRDASAFWPDATLHETGYPKGNGPPLVQGVRTARYFYGELPRSLEKELYDLAVDPWQLENLAGDPTMAEIEAALAARLRDLRGD